MTTLFRSHDVPPTLTASQSFTSALLTEWVDLNGSRTSARAVQLWARSQPALAGFSKPADIVDTIDGASSERQDEIMLALLQLAQSGEQLAGRILLQQMLPKLFQLRRRVTIPAGNMELSVYRDRGHIIIATFWEVMATYPIHRRTTKIAANLALDTLGQVCRIAAAGAPELSLRLDPIEDNLVGSHIQPLYRPAAPEPAPDPGLPALLTWATDTGVLTADAAQLLNDIYAQGEAPLEYSRRLGLSHDTVKQRASRAKRRLREALEQQVA